MNDKNLIVLTMLSKGEVESEPKSKMWALSEKYDPDDRKFRLRRFVTTQSKCEKEADNVIFFGETPRSPDVTQ